ncbi:HAD family hydrolase [Mesobacillus subterraneus]|uniref:HAD family hydrolase n=1 Tax=Mesobacillus subterraneus TaxID=285983 RepID=UPI00273EFE9D|nr:HAD family hydrolase [Mesobacillus subterraneus]WLR57752.1 HAD family hydrolase [Mesobacillus subterraneus]
MATYKVILLDLDGTITDPKIGITKSVQYALRKMDIASPDVDQLEGFIGTPLQVSFVEYFDFDEHQTEKAIDFYRERFKVKGIVENELYPNILGLLTFLREQSFSLIVATSKPTIFAEQILQHFKIDHYFDLVVGSNLNGTRTSKTEIIQYVLDEYKQYKPEDFLMIGDRKHDIVGANHNGIDSIGVLYGYGSLEELKNSEPTYLVESVEQVKAVFDLSFTLSE